jgi:hypothetical protein
MGIQPCVWDGGAHHHPCGSSLQETHCLFREVWESSGVSQLQLGQSTCCVSFLV